MRIDTHPFKRVSGGSYCTRGGEFWIHRSGGRWHVLRMHRAEFGKPTHTIAAFRTLRDAVEFYREEVAA